MARSRSISKDKATPPYFAGIDLGGTNIKVGIVDDAGQVLVRSSTPTQTQRGPEEGARRMGEAVRKAVEKAGLSEGDVVYAGLATPGTMDIPKGMLLDPFNLPGWNDFPIRDRVAHHAGLPTAYANDANAAAYGEFWVGSGRTMHSMVLLTLGTGVGGGIIIGELSVDGEHSHGSECGHLIIDYHDDARMCPCGHTGHLEAYASAKAVVKRTEEALAGGHKSSLSVRLESGMELTPLVIAEEAEQGDGLCLQIILDTAMYLGVGITSFVHTIDPDGVVLGGAMDFGGKEHPLGKQFLERIQAEVHRRTFTTLQGKTTIDFAMLGGDAGFIGAAGIGRLAYRKHHNLPIGPHGH